MKVIEAERLSLHPLTIEDAPFILELLNEPSFLRYIGDKGVRTLDDARGYILNGPGKSYGQFGFGLYLVKLKESETPMGMCGLVKREALADVDLGFVFSPKFWGKGYAAEVAAAMKEAKERLGLLRLVAITTPDNVSSITRLEKLGFTFERMVKLTEEGAELKLCACSL